MKSPDAFRTISEAASELGVPAHVLRFWETRFSFIRPMKRAGGRRFYRPQDIEVLRGVRVLLHDNGYTIKGVQKLHKEQGLRRMMAAAGVAANPIQPHESTGPERQDTRRLIEPGNRPLLGVAARQRLGSVLSDLEGVKARLDALLFAGDDS